MKKRFDKQRLTTHSGVMYAKSEIGKCLRGANVSEVTAKSLKNQSFELVRRGFDPAAVTEFLALAAKKFTAQKRRITELEKVSGRFDQMQAKEDALRTAVLAAGKARDGVLAAAEEQAGRIVGDARKSAFRMLNEARTSSDDLLRQTGAEKDDLALQVDQLRSVVRQTMSLLKGMAAGALGDLTQAERMLEAAHEMPAVEDEIAVDIVDAEKEPAPSADELVDQMTKMMDGSSDATTLPDAVDKLLALLRSVG